MAKNSNIIRELPPRVLASAKAGDYAPLCCLQLPEEDELDSALERDLDLYVAIATQLSVSAATRIAVSRATCVTEDACGAQVDDG